MLLVADSSALIPLSACDSLGLLELLALEVIVPGAVARECTVEGQPEARRLERYVRSRTVEVDSRAIVITTSGLGRGELEALALAKSRDALLAVDDRRARAMARLNGIPVIGSLGILIRAKRRGVIGEIRPLIAAARAGGCHYSESLVEEALRLAGESRTGL